jgi:hypothetical protein
MWTCPWRTDTIISTIFRVTQQQLTQNNWFLNPSLSIEYAPKTKEKINYFSEEAPQEAIQRVNFSASLSTSEPDIMTMVNYCDDSDPLHVSYSNPDLKADTQSVELLFPHGRKEKAHPQRDG